MVKIGIYGASGYTGQELLKILLRHPQVTVAAVTSRRFKGTPLAEVYPHFLGLTDLAFTDATPEEVAHQTDLVFLALPHGVSMAAAPAFLKAGKRVIDLSADFRIRKVETYEQWYGSHSAPEWAPRSVYGIPELYRDAIRGAQLVANPGCYPTSVILALAPVLRQGWLDEGTLIVDSKSGVSGAGREPQIGSLFCEAHEGFKAYKVGGQHRHIPEMEQELSLCAGHPITLSFTPHLLPLNRGILSTIYGTLREAVGAADLQKLYRDFYRDEPFVRISKAGAFPNIASVRGSNYCDIGLAVDGRTNRLILISAIDNLIKGAAGQAVQNMNLLCGFAEGTALDMVPLFP